MINGKGGGLRDEVRNRRVRVLNTGRSGLKLQPQCPHLFGPQV